MIWYSKDPPTYIFDGDYWLNERTKELYYMNAIKGLFENLNRHEDNILFGKRQKILRIKC